MTGKTQPPATRDGTTLNHQLCTLTNWLCQLSKSEFAQPSVLPGWDIRTLCGHILLIADGFARLLEQPGPVTDRPVPASLLVQRYRRDVDQIEASTAVQTASRSGPELVSDIQCATERLEDALGSGGLPTVISTPRGPGTLTEFIRTRIVDTVTHADDLSRSLPEREPVPTPRKPLATACRTLAELLAEQHPGKSLEVRVPPYAAVQCGTGPEGPTHTRGTPPNVVEADPVTFLRLATGRLPWIEATNTGLVTASGQRADLSTVLPVLS